MSLVGLLENRGSQWRHAVLGVVALLSVAALAIAVTVQVDAEVVVVRSERERQDPIEAIALADPALPAPRAVPDEVLGQSLVADPLGVAPPGPEVVSIPVTPIPPTVIPATATPVPATPIPPTATSVPPRRRRYRHLPPRRFR